MITIIHGDDIVASRKKLTDLVASGKAHETVRFEGEGTDVSDIIQVFEAQSLFAEKKLIVLERFIAAKDKAVIASILNHLKKNVLHDVIFWEAKEIKKELLVLFPKTATVLFFKKEQPLFQFLDSIRPGNRKHTLSLLHKVLENESEELIFYMVVRQFRLLLGIATHAPISEVKRLAPWQKEKLLRQAQAFGKEKLLASYEKLFRIEQGVKTGSSPQSVAASLDLFLADI